MYRRTKIVCTLGPATDAPEVLEKLLLAGANIVRLNFSHGESQDHIDRANNVRMLAAKHGLHVAILGDLQGPKIRVAKFKDGSIDLVAGDRFILDAQLGDRAGDIHAVGIDYKALPDDCDAGDRLLLDDGRVILVVDEIDGSKIYCTVDVGGKLSNNKGLNREGGGLSAPALTEKDIRDIQTAADINVDYLAVSFPRNANDMDQARALLKQVGSEAGLVAKVERAEAVSDVDVLDGIILASEAVMVARGDLGVEIGDAKLIAVQKHLIQRCRELKRCAITATQMMESMISSPLPTRAEVFDVANAVLDGTDAVMLSAESAAGDYPVESVEAMHRIILGAEEHPTAQLSGHRMHESFTNIDESIALSAMYAANHLEGVKAVICLSESGNTPLQMSRISSRLPIFAFSRHERTQTRVALYRGVQTALFDPGNKTDKEVSELAIEHLKGAGFIHSGDLVILTKGAVNNLEGGTNILKIERV
ncbi:MAG: pyruvate kinase [Arenicella sp.]